MDQTINLEPGDRVKVISRRGYDYGTVQKAENLGTDDDPDWNVELHTHFGTLTIRQQLDNAQFVIIEHVHHEAEND